MRETFHLVPADLWAATDRTRPYAAASLRDEGFIHCTDGEAELGATFDRHYATDPRSFVALTLDLDALGVPWRFDDPGSPYPHVYGPIPPDAVIAIADVERDPDGRFAGLHPR
jgi:uncharacterized protein (DUF952 family)